jgi:HlyD family secretion protein
MSETPLSPRKGTNFMKKKWRIIIGIAVALILLVLGLRACGKAGGKKMAQDAAPQSYTVARGDIVTKIEITGEVQPKTVVALKSKVSGKIVKLYADENDYVSQGQKIADIEPDYNQANTLFSTKAQLSRAEMRLRNARKDLEDKRVLLAKDYISREAFQAAEDELSSAQIDHQQAQSQYEMIKDMDVPGKVIHVYATSSGVVIERKVNEGEMVQSSLGSFGEGTVLMKIADLAQMTVASKINEVDIAKFRLGQEATIKLDALPYEEYSGRIVKIAPSAVVENNAKVFPVEISIDASGAKAKPGMTAVVTIIGESRLDVLVIPIRAVFTDDKGQDIVYMLPKTAVKAQKDAPEQEPLPTPLQLGANDLQQVEVLSGLKEGDRISLTEPGSAKNNMMFMGM